MVLLGFGARGWYMAAVPNSWDGVAALTGTAGVVLARPLPSAPEALFGPDRVVALRVSPEGMASLRDFLRATLAAGPGIPVRLANGPYPGSAFYAAATRYGLGYTCNTWTVDALRAAGLPVSAWGVVSAGEAMWQARRAAGTAAPAPLPTGAPAAPASAAKG